MVRNQYAQQKQTVLEENSPQVLNAKDHYNPHNLKKMICTPSPPTSEQEFPEEEEEVIDAIHSVQSGNDYFLTILLFLIYLRTRSLFTNLNLLFCTCGNKIVSILFEGIVV